MFDAATIRCDFPILDSEVNGKKLVYLDSGATSQKPECVINCIEQMYRRHTRAPSQNIFIVTDYTKRKKDLSRKVTVSLDKPANTFYTIESNSQFV